MSTDINNDGQYDVLGLAWEGNELIWWEQTTRQGSETTSSSAGSLGIEMVIVSCMTAGLLSRNKKK